MVELEIGCLYKIKYQGAEKQDFCLYLGEKNKRYYFWFYDEPFGIDFIAHPKRTKIIPYILP